MLMYHYWNNKIGLMDTVVLVRVSYSLRVGGNKLDCHSKVSSELLLMSRERFIFDILVE